MKADSPRVTVIVPVYNAAPFLQRCVDGLARQTLRDIEIVLVDDGSTDDSKAIAIHNARSDDRIAVLEQTHTGPGAARNRGLDAARAPYVTFVDSDDDLTADGCEAMLRRADATGADMIVGRTQAWSGEAVPSRLDSRPGASVRALYTGRLSMGAYAKLYRRSFLCAHGIRFPPTMYIEDRHFLLQCLVAGARLAPLEAQVYHRHLRPDSTMRRVTLKHAMDATGIYQLDVALLERAGLLAACGLQAAWATLMVDLYLARAIPADDTTVHDTLRGELTRQEELFRRLPIPAPGRAVLGHAAGRLRRELAQGSRGFLATRIWLRLVRLLAT